MTKLLSTGEMIDKLKVGEVAEAVKYPEINLNIKKDFIVNDGRCFFWKTTKTTLNINDFTNGIKWKIKPNYVSFEEAMKALKDGKRISKLNEKTGKLLDSFDKSFLVGILSGTALSVGEWFDGKFVIEGDPK